MSEFLEWENLKYGVIFILTCLFCIGIFWKIDNFFVKESTNIDDIKKRYDL